MDSNKQSSPHVDSPVSEISSNSSGSDGSTTLTVGSLFAFAVMGTVPIFGLVWVIRKLMTKSKHYAKHPRRSQYKQSRQANQAKIDHINNIVDDLDSPTSSTNSYKLSSEEFQILGEKTVVTSTIASLPTATQPNEQHPSMKKETYDNDHLTDGDDTIVARLYENCVRLQQYLSFPTLSTTVTVTLPSKEVEARAKEYRRACRPQRNHLDEVVPTDMELGISLSRQRRCTNASDELLFPSNRDPGIISRYFGAYSRYETDDDDHSCPDQASLSSGSVSSSWLSTYSGDDDANRNYEIRQLGELVTL